MTLPNARMWVLLASLGVPLLIGAAKASKSYFDGPVCETIIAGDINGDCIVNFDDFALIAYHWLECTDPGCGINPP